MVAPVNIIVLDVLVADNTFGVGIGYGLDTFGKFDTGSGSYSIQAGTQFRIDDNAEHVARLTRGTRAQLFSLLY